MVKKWLTNLLQILYTSRKGIAGEKDKKVGVIQDLNNHILYHMNTCFIMYV